MSEKCEHKYYRISLNVIGEELTYIWVNAKSRREAVNHVKFNIHPRASIQDVSWCSKPEPGTTVHVVTDNGVNTERIPSETVEQASSG